MNNYFCRLFEDNTIWLIIIAILALLLLVNFAGGIGDRSKRRRGAMQ